MYISLLSTFFSTYNIGSMTISPLDLIDFFIFSFIIYQIYTLLRGNFGYGLFLGILLLFIIWWAVNALDMQLMSSLLNQFINVGVIILVIIFQPEIRRFLLFIGNTTLRKKSNFLSRLLMPKPGVKSDRERQIMALSSALLRMSRDRTGSLLVLSGDISLESIIGTGTLLDAVVTRRLIESIFNKKSPLHDGALIISKGRAAAASCILPLSENGNLPSDVGLRHRAALGISERYAVAAIVVSEENGHISTCFQGLMKYQVSNEELLTFLQEHI
ncbi:MAG: diadenylate cyclase [Bacteroidota bacterium]